MNFETIFGLILILFAILFLAFFAAFKMNWKRLRRMHRQQAARHEDYLQSI